MINILPVISLLPISSKFTLQYLLCNDGWSSFKHFCFRASMKLRVLSRGWQRDIVGERGAPVFPAAQHSGSLVWVWGHLVVVCLAMCSECTVPWWSHNAALVWPVVTFTWSFQYGHPALHSSCPPQCPDYLGSRTTLKFVSCHFPNRDTSCSGCLPHRCSTLNLCPRAGHQLWLTYLLGLQRAASCLLRSADQLWPH